VRYAIPVQQGQERGAEAQPEARDRRFTAIFEVREDRLGGYWRLVTLSRATREEREPYEENS
jgi:hypothetical protein